MANGANPKSVPAEPQTGYSLSFNRKTVLMLFLVLVIIIPNNLLCVGKVILLRTLLIIFAVNFYEAWFFYRYFHS